jgi:hypothetical protein
MLNEEVGSTSNILNKDMKETSGQCQREEGLFEHDGGKQEVEGSLAIIIDSLLKEISNEALIL